MGTTLPILVPQSRACRVAPVRGRRTFAELRRSKRRARSGPVRVQFVPAQESDGARRVAYTVPRKVGTAVERNRCRRRLRSVVVETAASLPAGTYLVGIDQVVRGLPFQELRARVIEAMQRASQASW
jgi:ribonuclease P protein component